MYVVTVSVEISITQEVDDVVREVVVHFKDSGVAGTVTLHQMCRMLYHLREGPLLNGPCVVRTPIKTPDAILLAIYLCYTM